MYKLNPKTYYMRQNFRFLLGHRIRALPNVGWLGSNVHYVRPQLFLEIIFPFIKKP